MGIILRYLCWGTHRPPPGGPAVDRPTRRPPRFRSTKGGGRGPPPPFGGGWGSPPPTAPQTVEHPSGSHIGWRPPPCSEEELAPMTSCDKGDEAPPSPLKPPPPSQPTHLRPDFSPMQWGRQQHHHSLGALGGSVTHLPEASCLFHLKGGGQVPGTECCAFHAGFGERRPGPDFPVRDQP